MDESTYKVTERRPVAARRLGFFQRLAPRLAAAGVSANSISVGGLVAGIAAGTALYCTRYTPQPEVRILWLAAAGCVQLRLIANLLDGMVAISSGKASAVGELFNEVPDRVSDPATLIGLGYAAGAWPMLGWLAALLAVLTAYVRIVGKAAGKGEAGSDFCGPMAKQHRMFVVTMLCLFCAIAPQSWQTWRPADAALLIIIVGSFVTAGRRLMHIAKQLKAAA
ncbi:MAG TPA: CDP-alcohol phosphatidyltransferase family protein [Tepidisphaeraceae bacterium]|jgi:phosphatidylglycerophosphate synthase|nr:CDP-alcohol phosphatidyltransferase family protein [Tepidisphaeraceae bacterium]